VEILKQHKKAYKFYKKIASHESININLLKRSIYFMPFKNYIYFVRVFLRTSKSIRVLSKFLETLEHSHSYKFVLLRMW